MKHTSLSVAPSSSTPAATAPPLRGHWLVVARMAWLAVTLSAVVYYAVTLPSYYAYLQVVTPACHGCLQLSPAGAQALQQLGLPFAAYAGFVISVQIFLLLGWGAVAAVLFWRASADRVALLASLTLVLCATYLYGAPAAPPAWPVLPYEAARFLGWACLGLFLGVFPSGRFVAWWTRWLVLLWIACGATIWFLPSTLIASWPAVVVGLIAALAQGLTVGLIAAQIDCYRRVSTPTQRQQTKWAVLGIGLGVAGYAWAFGVFVVLPPPMMPLSRLDRSVGYLVGELLSLFIPMGIGIAILRHRLFDIDVIIRRTLLYSSLTAILAGVYFGVVVGLQSLSTALTHQTNPQPVIIVASTLLIAMLANPLRRRIQMAIDRRFYRRKYDAARTLEAFAATLRTETDLRELSEQLMMVVEETMQPAHVSLWLRAPVRQPGIVRATTSTGEREP